MFRTLIYPSSGVCDYSVELPRWSYCSWFDVCWSFGVVGLEWYPCCRLKPATRIPLHSVPSPFRQNGLCLHCLSCSVAFQKSLRLFPSNMQPHSFCKRHLAATALMLDEEEKNAALSVGSQVFQKQNIRRRLLNSVQRIS